jgi:hypothetical protein
MSRAKNTKYNKDEIATITLSDDYLIERYIEESERKTLSTDKEGILNDNQEKRYKYELTNLQLKEDDSNEKNDLQQFKMESCQPITRLKDNDDDDDDDNNILNLPPRYKYLFITLNLPNRPADEIHA